jgi:glucan 1,3-beta-glucosidase
MSSLPPIPGQGVAYDPIPNPQEPSDIRETPYDSPHEQATADHSLDDLSIDQPSVNLVRPRFLGSLDGEGIRGSIASYGSHAQSEGLSSLYALNPESLSARGSPRPESERFSGRYHDDPRTPVDDTFDGPSVPLSSLSSQPRFLAEKQAAYGSYASKSRRNTIILSAIGGLILLIIAVVLPVYFLAIKHTSNNSATQQSHGTTATAPSATSSSSSKTKNLITGGDGSTVKMEDGTTFTYQNAFGGRWYYDPNDPFNNGAQAQSWTPALNQTFKYGSDRIRGYVTRFGISINFRWLNLGGLHSVNIGGWLVTEPVSFPAIVGVGARPHSSPVYIPCSLPKISKRSR